MTDHLRIAVYCALAVIAGYTLQSAWASMKEREISSPSAEYRAEPSPQSPDAVESAQPCLDDLRIDDCVLSEAGTVAAEQDDSRMQTAHPLRPIDRLRESYRLTLAWIANS
jgi:hypothetical protein